VLGVAGALWAGGDEPPPVDSVATTPQPLRASAALKLEADAANVQSGDLFGFSVAVTNQLAVVGARSDDAGIGAVYLFEREGDDGWSLAGPRLRPESATAGAAFGAAVSALGDRVLVGAAGDSVRGAVYVVEPDVGSGAWRARQKLLGEANGDQFGAAVELAGERAIVGAPLFDAGAAVNAGTAYIVERQASGTWSLSARLAASVQAGAQLGRSVSLDGDLALIGAPLDGADNTGAAYVFRYEHAANTWAQEAKLVVAEAAPNDELGWAVALRGTTAVVTTRRADGGRGAAHVFQRQAPGQWVRAQKLVASDPDPLDQLGTSVALAGKRLLVGATGDQSATGGGAAYLFELRQEGGEPAAWWRSRSSSESRST